MTAIHGHETGALLQAYDFSPIQVLADIGGGNGSLIGAVLQRYPKLKGLLFDLGHVIGRGPRKPGVCQTDRKAVVRLETPLKAETTTNISAKPKATAGHDENKCTANGAHQSRCAATTRALDEPAKK
jgi:hypothetical protein